MTRWLISLLCSLEQDDGAIFETGAVTFLVDIPPARLAVCRSTGFVTKGEIARQKDVLLQELELDGWEIDVDHGAIVPFIIFQYNRSASHILVV